jgi:hypothetical protein
VSQYPWLLLAVYVVTVGVVQLLALWAATSRLPWLLRVLVVWAPIALLLPIRAYEPALLLILSATWTIFLELGIQDFGRWHERKWWFSPRWKFRLADLLVVTLLVATLLGTAKQVIGGPPRAYAPFPFVTLLASLIAAVTVLAYHAVMRPSRWQKALALTALIWFCALLLRANEVPLFLGEGWPSLAIPSSREEAGWAAMQGALPLTLVICLVAPLIASRTTRNWSGRSRLLILAAAIGISLVVGIATACLLYDMYWVTPRHIQENRLLEIAIHSILFFGLAGFVALGAVLARLGWGEAAGWPRHAARTAILLAAVFVGAPAVWIYWQMLRFPSYPSVNYGSTNNYDRIMETGGRMKGHMNSAVALPPNLREKLDEAAILLRSSNYVPSTELEADPKESAGLATFDWLSLSQQLSGACVDAAKNRQIDRAADYAIAVIRYGTMFERGSTSGYVWTARGIQEFGYQRLAMFRGDLSAAKSREIIRLLQQSLRERDDEALLLARDRVMLARTGHWRPRLEQVLQELSGSDARPEHAVPLEELRKRIETLNRLLQTDLAIRLFQSDHGRLPASLAELTSEYLAELPLDPYSGQALIYRPSEEEGDLYSVGPDGKDDGGIFLHRPPSDGKYPYDVRLLQVPLK